jgi:TRAP-type uncharacterized transport system fused permease subunit
MAFGWTLFVIPFLFVFSGTLLLKGDPLSIAIDATTAVAGVWLISAAVMGHALRPLGLVGRALYAATGIALLLPVGAFAAARWLNLAGAVAAVALIAWERARRHAEALPAADAVPPPTEEPGVAAPTDQRAALDRLGVRGSGDAE